ncbi:hypothetical protein [Runella zeae]|uniref:hypothetical protein n=1 Tax=Runella zeae TaxID=94255 RepID=UPI002355A0CA|nr:hypothetical protein [Runella zeae]
MSEISVQPVVIVNGYARRTEVEIQNQLREALGDQHNFITLYFSQKEGEAHTNKAIHFKDEKGEVFFYLGQGINNDPTKLVQCLFKAEALFYYFDKGNNALQASTFANLGNIPDFVSDTIKSTVSQRAGHNAPRYTALP